MLKDTIISAFNYDGTLLKWLKKVEEALQGDTLTNIEVVTNSDYSMQLKLTFGDGTFILSPSFTNKGRGIVSISKTATSGLVDTYTVTYTDNTTSTFTVTNAEGLNANNLYSTLTAGTGIELTNDGQNVTVTAKRLLSEIVDTQGRQRFQEGNISTIAVEGITYTYNKWSLSGTHLLIVLCLEVEAEKAIQGTNIAFVYLPTWLKGKITRIAGDVIDTTPNQPFTSSFTPQVANGRCTLLKNMNSDLVINFYAPDIKTDKLAYRLKFDLLIDTD